MAFSDIHSGAAPATGSSSRLWPIPPSLTISQQAVRIRELSTHGPKCKIGGHPTASQISSKPRPAYLNAASGVSKPSLAQAVAAQPVCTTKTSFLINSLTKVIWVWPLFNLGLSQPTTPATPRILPAIIPSFKGLKVNLYFPPNILKTYSVVNPPINSWESLGICTRDFSRRG